MLKILKKLYYVVMFLWAIWMIWGIYNGMISGIDGDILSKFRMIIYTLGSFLIYESSNPILIISIIILCIQTYINHNFNTNMKYFRKNGNIGRSPVEKIMSIIDSYILNQIIICSIILVLFYASLL